VVISFLFLCQLVLPFYLKTNILKLNKKNIRGKLLEICPKFVTGEKLNFHSDQIGKTNKPITFV